MRHLEIPDEIARADTVKRVIGKGKNLRVAEYRINVRAHNVCSLSGLFEHLGACVKSRDGKPRLGEQHREKTRSATNVKHRPLGNNRFKPWQIHVLKRFLEFVIDLKRVALRALIPNTE